MAVNTYDYTTGPTALPDLVDNSGRIEYNGCRFSPYFVSEISGVAVKDEAQRTVKYMEYNLKVDGYVTLPAGASTISPTMSTLRLLLSAQAGTLVYVGRGCDLIVNRQGGSTKDVAWGPVPEVLDFQPLGAGRSAKVVWQCKVRIYEARGTSGDPKSGTKNTKNGQTHTGLEFLTDGENPPSGNLIGTKSKVFKTNAPSLGGIAAKVPMLQFNYESTVSYGEDGYSALSISGVLEIPMTRSPNQTTRTLQLTADEMRGEIDRRVFQGIDLNKFRITSRDFNLSRDKRTLTWNIRAEEIPYQQMPPSCTVARGSYSVRPANQGMGLASWMCTLRVSYTIRADKPRRLAWFAFLALLRDRMKAGNQYGDAPPLEKGQTDNLAAQQAQQTGTNIGVRIGTAFQRAKSWFNPRTQKYEQKKEPEPKVESRHCFLIDFNIEEGLYLDSKTVTFSATWKLVTSFSHILLASGLWRKLPEEETPGKNYWATSVADISGSQSWLACKAHLDVIVDLGGG